MAAHLRRISIGAAVYLWRIQRVDERYVMLRVWAVSRRRRDFPLELRLRFDDPWLNYGPILTASPEQRAAHFQLNPITPANVRQIILAALAAGWQADQPAEPQRFARNAE